MNDVMAKIVFILLRTKYIKTCKALKLLQAYYFYSNIAAIPGSVFPSKLSSIAPPPVLT
ncbi:hypothetical protein SAMN04487987_102254 [Algibacter pectinivorans]|uniref:Uncharacterized protein n=1 Tax=Algibacter pectinivorans TaxID=870482 RepID=A0A1I1NN86_9FLAO|nr:hypothetical protein SAMN04487987_102254 [Algibacter pectinivorans]